ncbi:MAG TPA: hypothetical protein VJ742_00765 [Nitrososphaera sp.]|nr:hypothetical protein [Nitrososphaera sp.]
MTPFVKWKINMLKAYNGFFPDDPEGLIRAAWLEATRLAYEDCAKIAKEMEIKLLNRLLENCGVDGNVDGCESETAMAIQSRLKELVP